MTIKDTKGTINMEALGKILSQATGVGVFVYSGERTLILCDTPLSAVPNDLMTAIVILGAEIRW